MPYKTVLALLLLSLGVSVHAQDAATPLEKPSGSTGPHKPSMAPIFSAFLNTGMARISTKVLVVYDASGHVLEATVQPSTHNRSLDKAIREWALQVQLTPGPAGQDWLPISMSR